MVTDKIAEYFNDNPMVIGLTYSAHPTLCAAALENLKIIEEDNLVERAAEMGQYIEAEVVKLKAKHPSIGDFRNTGLLGCIELVKNRKTKGEKALKQGQTLAPMLATTKNGLQPKL